MTDTSSISDHQAGVHRQFRVVVLVDGAGWEWAEGLFFHAINRYIYTAGANGLRSHVGACMIKSNKSSSGSCLATYR